MNKFMSDPFYIKVFGEYALFTDPSSKGGGDKFTYLVPTRQALHGIVDACYFKPTIVNVVDEVKVINKIETETMGIRTMVRYGRSSDLNYYTYLKNVEYLIKYHFEWNMARKDLAKDRNENKHQAMMLRSIKRGGRRDVFLGTRECVAYVEKLSEDEYIEHDSYYKDKNLNFGIQYQEFEYPDEDSESESLYAYYGPTLMKNGVIRFQDKSEYTIKNKLSDYNFKTFDMEKIKSVDEEVKEF